MQRRREKLKRCGWVFNSGFSASSDLVCFQFISVRTTTLNILEYISSNQDILATSQREDSMSPFFHSNYLQLFFLMFYFIPSLPSLFSIKRGMGGHKKGCKKLKLTDLIHIIGSNYMQQMHEQRFRLKLTWKKTNKEIKITIL